MGKPEYTIRWNDLEGRWYIFVDGEAYDSDEDFDFALALVQVYYDAWLEDTDESE